MQTVWSRVGQIGRSCACPSCTASFTRPAIVRKVSSAVHTVRSNPFASGTALYTGIFAAATLLDGRQKISRREQLNDTLAASRQEVENLQKAVQHKLDQLRPHRPLLVEASPLNETDTLANPATEPEIEGRAPPPVLEEMSLEPAVAIRRLYSDIPLQRSTPTLDQLGRVVTEHEQDRVRIERRHFYNTIRYTPYSGRLNSPQIPSLSDHPELCNPPQSLWAHPGRRHRWAKVPVSEKKAYVSGLAVAKLVLQLLLASGLSNQIHPAQTSKLPQNVLPYAQLSAVEAKDMLRTIEIELMKAHALAPDEKPLPPVLGIPIPKYSPNLKPLVEQSNHDLAEAWKARLNGWVDEQYVIADVCSTLLKLRSNPDAHTANILLSGFLATGRVGRSKSENEPDFISPVIDFCMDAHLRPNEVTCAKVLRTHRLNDDPKRFSEYIGLMMGRNFGLMLANPEVRITPSAKARLVPYESRIRNAGTKIVQAVNPSALVFAEIIRGLLHFTDLDETIRFCCDLEEHGWGLGWECMESLLARCAVEKHWEHGVYVWGKILKLNQKGYDIPGHLYGIMLVLCRFCDQRELFAKLFERGLSDLRLRSQSLYDLVRKELQRIEKLRWRIQCDDAQELESRAAQQ